jgi:fructosamine-3-kinase
MSVFRKRGAGVPAGYFAWEAAGLRWLAAAGGAAVVEVLDVGEQHLDLARLVPAGPTPDRAGALGRALASTHDAGAAAYGSAPEGWEGDGFFGPLEEPLPMVLGAWDSWGAFYAEARLAPVVRRCRDARLLDEQGARLLDRVCRRLEGGELDTDDRPARLHGDLWSGNVLWTEDGAVLIDPAAHGGHRETDLALLALFGAPHLDRVVAGYDEAHPLADGWRDRVGLHQLHCLLVHVAVYGGGYVDRTLRVAATYA